MMVYGFYPFFFLEINLTNSNNLIVHVLHSTRCDIIIMSIFRSHQAFLYFFVYINRLNLCQSVEPLFPIL